MRQRWSVTSHPQLRSWEWRMLCSAHKRLLHTLRVAVPINQEKLHTGMLRGLFLCWVSFCHLSICVNHHTYCSVTRPQSVKPMGWTSFSCSFSLTDAEFARELYVTQLVLNYCLQQKSVIQNVFPHLNLLIKVQKC